MAGGQSSAAPADAGQSLGGAWQPYRGIYDLPGRLGRSAAITLILSPIGLLLISVIRLLIVADYNPVTASAIVSSGGYVDTLLGTIIPLVPIFAPYLALVLLFFNRVVPAILTLLATAFMSPVVLAVPAARVLAGNDWQLIIHSNPIYLIFMVLAGLVFVFLLALEFMGLGFAVAARTVATVACIVLIPFIMKLYPFPLSNEFYAGLLKQPWLPAQTITLVSGQKFTGYVLSDNGTWVVVLDDGTRAVHYYRNVQVAAQQICQIRPAPPKPPLIPLFPAHLNAITSTPDCATLQAGRVAALPTGGRRAR
jgi:hypothetical protein